MKALGPEEGRGSNPYYAGNFDGESDELRDLRLTLVAERDALKAENDRLTNCLKKANDQAEDFERRWYLADMELERIKALEPVAWIRPSGKAMLEAGGNCTVYASEGMSNHSTALYALGSKT